MQPAFPNIYPLNGSDYFQVFLDRHHRRHGMVGNVSRLILTFDEKLSSSELKKILNDSAVLRWMYNLRLKTSSFFRVPRWQLINNPQAIELIEKEIEDVDWMETHEVDIDPWKNAPIKFELFNLKKQSFLVISWNHILLDARGMEILVSHLANGNEISYFSDSANVDLSWKLRLKEIQTVKDFLIPNVKNGLNLFSRNKSRTKHNYRTVHFTAEETEQIDQVADSFKVGVAKSAFYLAALQSAYGAIASEEIHHCWIPVPQDHRRKGQAGPVVSNHVSYMFYHADARSSDMHEIVKSFRTQMMDQMRARLPQSYHVMMDSMLRFPAWLYRHLVTSPTKGAMASYFYSDVGTSLDSFDSIFGAKLKDALHLQPNCGFPGLTIIFMRYQGRQKVVLSFPKNEASKRKLTSFEHVLRSKLLTSA